ncbi:putative selenium-dependent hydroxylase accessory protein YqeC [Candidatus Desulfarcum epimagneticum]|uniref:Putative selenium-dependent hydroxylase accessory protein YqeC n=1 Tax=uncultured Desulfobacteraceae bacterium TaxID=218296 RepID=A0A484HEN3_9BACT|nr:putative selenium-dependent hydroxylase accessory protein YqeC [uncultured Desulfobacteraceae bacterium]
MREIRAVSCRSLRLKESFLLKDGGVVSLVGAGGKTSLMFRLARELSEEGASVLTATTTRIRKPSWEQSRHVIWADSPDDLARRAKKILKKSPHVSAGSGPGSMERPGKLTGFSPEFIDEVAATGLFKWIIIEADGAAMKPIKAPAPHEPVIPSSSEWIIGVLGLKNIGKPLAEAHVFRSRLFGRLSGLAPGDPVSGESAAVSIVHEKGIMKGAPARAVKIAFLNMAGDPQRLETGRRVCAAMARMKGRVPDRAVIGQALGNPPAARIYDFNPGRRHDG